MTTSVDVLAVMDSAHYLLTLHVWDPLHPVDRDNQQLSREARDAVAELIEAVQEVLEADASRKLTDELMDHVSATLDRVRGAA